MLSYTLENVLMLTVFQLLISGVILCSSLAFLYLQKEGRKFLILVAVAIALYSLHLFLATAFLYRNLSASTATVMPPLWKFLGEALEKAALVFLPLSFVPTSVHEKLGEWLWAVVVFAFILLAGLPYVVSSYWPAASSRYSFSALVNGVWLVGMAGFIVTRKPCKALMLGFTFFLLSAAQFLRALSPRPAYSEWIWMLVNGALLLGLGLLALVVESSSTHLPIRFFLRLNLIFIAVASMLIMTVAEMERRQYLDIAEKNTVELSEYLRGEILHLFHQGLRPAEILSGGDIVRKIASDFGRLPDLHRVRIRLHSLVMDMAIADDGMVTHQIYPEVQLRGIKRSVNERGRVATLTPTPIMYNGEVVGGIELDESLRTINAEVARHMRIIFLTFTAAVFVAASLFGVNVQYAHKTIQRQFRELENTNAQLIHVERLASVGELAGGLAHEINNPAGIIVVTSDYLLRESEKQRLPQTFREDLGAIRRQALRVSEIVNGLLTFSRPTTLRMQPTNANAVLEQSLHLLAPRLRDQRVRVVNQLMPDLPSISADPNRLEQVFVNLFNNAADAMPNGGVLTVESTVRQLDGRSYVEISVADSGSGIANEHLKSVFDPFFTTKPKGKGTGLGLSVTHGIIRDHKGRIEVESQLGRGTVFRVYLPEGSNCLEET